MRGLIGVAALVQARYSAFAECLANLDKPRGTETAFRTGIDIGAKEEVHQLLRKLAAEGTAVLAISSELPEIMSLCDRIVTVKEGRITGDMPASEATEEKLMKLMVLGPGEEHVHVVAPR